MAEEGSVRSKRRMKREEQTAATESGSLARGSDWWLG